MGGDTLNEAIWWTRKNPIEARGRNSISRFGAILDNGTYRAWGWNQYKTHPLQAKFSANSSSLYLHAELAAIIDAIRLRAREEGIDYNRITDLSDFKLSVARVLKNGTPALAKPCIGCQRAIMAFGIKDVEWTV